MILDSTNQKLTKVVVAQTFLNVASKITKIFEKLRTVACQIHQVLGRRWRIIRVEMSKQASLVPLTSIQKIREEFPSRGIKKLIGGSETSAWRSWVVNLIMPAQNQKPTREKIL